MIWFAIILAVVIGGAVGLFTRNFARALKAGLITLMISIAIALIVIYSGLMGDWLVS
jgi:uncharacterized membrane protein YhiD involved in acid resistance